jgi:hypothetical protein
MCQCDAQLILARFRYQLFELIAHKLLEFLSLLVVVQVVGGRSPMCREILETNSEPRKDAALVPIIASGRRAIKTPLFLTASAIEKDAAWGANTPTRRISRLPNGQPQLDRLMSYYRRGANVREDPNLSAPVLSGSF